VSLVLFSKKDAGGHSQKVLVCPDWPDKTRFKVVMEGKRRVVTETHLCLGERNLRSNTGDDLKRVAHNTDASAGFNPKGREATTEKIFDGVAAVQRTKGEKDEAKRLQNAAKADAKRLEKEEKEKEKEEARLMKERERALAKELKEKEEEEAKERKAQNEKFISSGVGKATTAKNLLGAKRYSTGGGGGAKATKPRGAKAKSPPAEGFAAMGMYRLGQLVSCLMCVLLVQWCLQFASWAFDRGYCFTGA
jgi:hypothetical protein